MLWTGLATAVIAAGWLTAWAAIGWYRSLDAPEGADLLVAVTLVTASLLATGVATVAFVHVVRRGRTAQKPLETWTALDRQPPARSLPPGNIPQTLASTWDLMRAGQPWKETVPVDGRRYLAFMSAGSMVWMTVPIAPLMIGAVVVLATLTGDISSVARVGVVGAGVVPVAVGLWAVGKGLRHYVWALGEARTRVAEEKTWPVAPHAQVDPLTQGAEAWQGRR